jgi:hypothetical protein
MMIPTQNRWSIFPKPPFPHHPKPPKPPSLPYTNFIYPHIHSMLSRLSRESELRDPNSSKLKIHKIKESLRAIKAKINEYQTLYLKIEDLATGRTIAEDTNSASHQFICPYCKKNDLLLNGLFDELVHMKLLFNDVRIKVVIQNTNSANKLRVYIALNTKENFPYFGEGYRFRLGSILEVFTGTNLGRGGEEVAVGGLSYFGGGGGRTEVVQKARSISMFEGRWRYLASICDDIFYHSELVIHILPGLNLFNYDESWNIGRQKKNYWESNHVENERNKKRLEEVVRHKDDFYHNKPMFSKFNDESLLLESDNEDEIEDLTHFEDKVCYEYPEFDFDDIKMMNEWNR